MGQPYKTISIGAQQIPPKEIVSGIKFFYVLQNNDIHLVTLSNPPAILYAQIPALAALFIVEINRINENYPGFQTPIEVKNLKNVYVQWGEKNKHQYYADDIKRAGKDLPGLIFRLNFKSGTDSYLRKTLLDLTLKLKGAFSKVVAIDSSSDKHPVTSATPNTQGQRFDSKTIHRKYEF